MRVLVTGASGFVGKATVAKLIERGATLRCLLRRESDRSSLEKLDCEIVEGDLQDSASLTSALQDCSTVLHLAAETNPAKPSLVKDVNLKASEELARLSKEAGVERFVYLSALNQARQGATASRPWAVVTGSKQKAEALISAHLPAIILRSAPCYGPGDNFTLPLLKSIRRIQPLLLIPGQGTFQMQPIWIDDLADCLALATLEGKTENECRDLAGPQVLSGLEFLGKLASASSYFKINIHVPETLLKFGGLPLLRALGRREWLSLAEKLIAHTATERNFAPALLGRDLISIENGLNQHNKKEAKA
ncbi:MAG: NAD-dependent epimerase/dehydratase family protein [Deltaproteobacteria bacterium]|nr:NAD-dependent epimerase/dehydratase family protein [Deltaproteobacteria bacterium]